MNKRNPSVPGNARQRWWFAAAALVAASGTAFAFLAGTSVVRNDARESRQAFESTSIEIASALRLAIQREEDLLVDSRVYFSRNPGATQADFAQFWTDLDVTTRYPEYIAFGHVVEVPKAALAAFTRARDAARAATAPPGETPQPFVVVPPGDRPSYCLVDVAMARPEKAAAFSSVPPGIDVCVANGAALHAVRTSGRSAAGAIDLDGKTLLTVHAAVYRPGADVSTVSARNEAFQGWVAMTFDTQIVFERALAGHPNTALEMRFRDGGVEATFVAGEAPSRGQSTTVDVGLGWDLKISGPVHHAGLFSNHRARNLVLTLTAVAWLLALLLFVLASGRRRALGLVAQRTAELEASERDKGKLLNGLVAASEKERSRVAAELHDGPIQRLAAVGYALDRARTKLLRGERQGFDILTATRGDLTDVIGGVRRLMSELRPPVLDESGLAGALRDYAARYTAETGIACEVSIDDGVRIGPELETIIYRVSQEALTNVRKHAEARNTEIIVTVRDGVVNFGIGDDGVGFDTQHQGHFLDTEHYGLRAMRERVENAGGAWAITSVAGLGTTIRASMRTHSVHHERVLVASA